MKVARWGNSLALRLPAAIVEVLDLKEGDEVNVRVADLRDIGLEKKPTRDELIARLDKYRGTLPDDFKFDREEANAR